MLDRRPHLQAIRAADHLVHRPESEFRHQLAHVFGDEPEVVLDELRLAGELLAQLRILGRDADRAGIQVADPHHDAARHDQRGGRESELLGAEQRRDHHVAPGAQLAVRLHDDAVAQPVEHQHLLGLGQAQFPGHAGMLDRGQRRRASPAVVSRDQHHVGMGLGHAGGDRAHAHFRHQLHVNARLIVRVLQVVDQLREILDRVDVVVRRRRDQRDPRRRMPHLRDPRIHLVARQLSAFTGLGPLGHLDLQVVGVHEVFAGDAEPR